MDRSAWLRQNKQLTQTATRNPDPRKREEASKKLSRLNKQYREQNGQR